MPAVKLWRCLLDVSFIALPWMPRYPSRRLLTRTQAHLDRAIGIASRLWLTRTTNLVVVLELSLLSASATLRFAEPPVKFDRCPLGFVLARDDRRERLAFILDRIMLLVVLRGPRDERKHETRALFGGYYWYALLWLYPSAMLRVLSAIFPVAVSSSPVPRLSSLSHLPSPVCLPSPVSCLQSPVKSPALPHGQRRWR
ncbi:hypothetical protein G7046_g7836 [Stylonectria norvegica]|nr:hypothetical protein G7046_g7836 [Stylonectria norvegica]